MVANFNNRKLNLGVTRGGCTSTSNWLNEFQMCIILFSIVMYCQEQFFWLDMGQIINELTAIKVVEQ